jgi:hypothetical protein
MLWSVAPAGNVPHRGHLTLPWGSAADAPSFSAGRCRLFVVKAIVFIIVAAASLVRGDTVGCAVISGGGVF